MSGVVQILSKYPQLDCLHSRHQYPKSLRQHTMPLLLQLPVGTNRTTESRKRRGKVASCGSLYSLISSARLLLYTQSAPPLSEDISHTFLRFVGYMPTEEQLNLLSDWNHIFLITQNFPFLFLIFCKTRTGDRWHYLWTQKAHILLLRGRCKLLSKQFLLNIEETRNLQSLVFMPTDRPFIDCSSHSSITADTARLMEMHMQTGHGLG